MIDDSVITQNFLSHNENAYNTGKLLTLTLKNQEVDIMAWLIENRLKIEKSMQQYGGVLLRDFGVHSVSEFNKIAQIFCPTLADYIYRSTPRKKLGGQIYTATEYPKERSIPLHNECSYSQTWPTKILFYCVIVASKGGETPIADCRRVYNKIDPSVREKFEKLGVLYVRNYTPGIDLSWQEVFQTEHREIVSQYCNDNNIECIWRDQEPEITTKQICKATLKHPITGENVWFNQAHLFHASAIDEKERLSLIKELSEDNLPRNTFYGNGEPIPLEILQHIKGVYQTERILFPWQKGDILLLDNLLMAHSREPYEGERKLAVAMG